MDRLDRVGPHNTHQSHSRCFKSLNENTEYNVIRIVIVALALSDPTRSHWDIKLSDRKACFPRNPSMLVHAQAGFQHKH